MKVININEVPKKTLNLPIMTGPDVTLQDITPDSKDFNMAIVYFGKGVRNKFHTHSYDQVLIVNSGEGIVATDEEERVVSVGDVVLIPAGEKHWHGATEDSEFCHLFVQHRNSATTQLED